MSVAAVSAGAEFSRFARALRIAAGGLESDGRKAVDRVAQGALRTAQAHAGVDSGDLRSSLRVSSRGGELRAAVETDLYYARFQEFGTSKMHPHPFMLPAFEQWQPELGRELEKLADKMAREL